MRLILIGFVLTTTFLISCKSDYEKLVISEMASGVEYKELPLGLSTGITKKEYFAECWDLNKQKVISQGSGNQYAKYYLMPEGVTDSLYKIKMLFYGMFDKEDVMRGMDMKMEFTNWAPWNEEFQSPMLMNTLEEHYMSTYNGNPFLSIKVSDQLSARVKVDGNRRITMYPIDDQKAAVKILDLNYDGKIKK